MQQSRASSGWDAFPQAIRIAPNIVWRDVEGDLILYDERDGSYHNLNRVGSFVWRRVGAGLPLPTIVRAAAEHFDASEAVVSQGIAGFVDEAVAKGLFERDKVPTTE